MKKHFLLFIAALCATVAVNATVFEVKSDAPNASDNIRRTIRGDYGTLVDGDTVLLVDDALYNETGDHSDITANVVLLAKEGTHPTIAYGSQKPCISGAGFMAKGIKFTGVDGGYFRVYTGASGKVIFEDCVFEDFSSYAILLDKSSVQLDELTFNNCLFKNVAGVAINMSTSGSTAPGIVKAFNLTNTTMINCGSEGDGWAFILRDNDQDVATEGPATLIDHCSFYNAGTGGDACFKLYKFGPEALVSNCVIAYPEDKTSVTGIYGYNGTVVKNCVYYNCKQARSGCVVTNETKADPLFTDPDNGDFSFAFTSPLFLAATDGSNIGDPRWGVAEPETAIAVPDTLPAMQAVLCGTKISASENGIAWNENSANPNDNSASWVIDVNKTGIYKLIINDTTGSGHTYIVSVANAEGWLYTKTQTEDAYTKGNHVFDAIIFNEVGKYMVCLKNGTLYSSSVANKIYLDYLGGAEVNLPGTLPNEDAILGGNDKVKVDEEGYICFSGDDNVPNCFAKWNANFTKKGEFGVSINVATTNGHKYKVQVLKGEAVVGEAEEPSQVNTQGEIILKGNIKLQEAGTYTIKLINQTAHSEARVKDITFTYSGGAVVNIPATLLPADAMLSENAFIDNDTIIFAPRGAEGHTPDGWAKWNVHLENDAICAFTAKCYVFNDNGSTFQIKVFNAENEVVYQKSKEIREMEDIEVEINLESTLLPAGDYVIQMQNTVKNSKGRLMSVVVEGSPILVITDNSDIDFSDYAGQTVNIKLNRTIKADMFTPFCLPFALHPDALNSVLKSDKAYVLDDAQIQDQTLSVKLQTYSSIYQGTPFLIKPTEEVVDPIFENVTIMDDPKASSTTKGNVTFQGSFAKENLTESDKVLLVGNNNTLFYPNDATTPYIKSMRAYFRVNVAANMLPRFAAFVEPGNAPTEMIIVGGEAERQKGHRKVLVDGQIRIQHEGKCYSILGLER